MYTLYMNQTKQDLSDFWNSTFLVSKFIIIQYMNQSKGATDYQ